ncbi:hypothetical protein KQX54_015450 [Cotesia glomerata]|uniref:Uncharacterized protein n=1 Tax=Cotesia glomerata TaxID=32391 RepID=A0AAV7HYW6_COTGL|nr:hypothetical protein KQX54_015450 [Cotesia glomerata]
MQTGCAVWSITLLTCLNFRDSRKEWIRIDCRGRYEPVEFKAAMIRSFACSFSGPMAICAKLPVANIVYGNYNGQAADHVPTVPSGLLSSSSSSSRV